MKLHKWLFKKKYFFILFWLASTLFSLVVISSHDKNLKLQGLSHLTEIRHNLNDAHSFEHQHDHDLSASHLHSQCDSHSHTNFLDMIFNITDNISQIDSFRQNLVFTKLFVPISFIKSILHPPIFLS